MSVIGNNEAQADKVSSFGTGSSGQIAEGNPGPRRYITQRRDIRMEAILGLAIGLPVGFLIAWLITKLRSKGNAARLETEVRLAEQKINDAERSRHTLQGEADSWREQAVSAREEVAGLNAQLNATAQNLDDAGKANAELRAESDNWQSKSAENAKKVAELQAQLDAANRRLSEQTDIEKNLLDQFRVMSSEVIANNNETFLASADEKVGTLVKQAKTDFDFSKEAVSTLVKPLADELKRIEEARNTSQGSLKQQIETLTQDNRTLAQETRNLTNALKRPEVRGTWGEVQLRRVVELAGMSQYCDYYEQVSVTSEDGKRDRPDMVVRMPNERTIVIDAKTPLNAYLSAMESDSDADRDESIGQHAKQVRERARGLAQKSYSNLFTRTPEFVVMFLPGEFFLQPALEKDPELLEWAMGQGIVIATPSTLMALLKTVEMGWREAKLAEEAAAIGDLGKELHDRLYTFAENMTKTRRSLDQTVKHFNSSVGSLESRVLPSARRFKELGVTSVREIDQIEPIEVTPRQLRSATAGDRD